MRWCGLFGVAALLAALTVALPTAAMTDGLFLGNRR
jgi:hypothetical protein